MLSAYAHKKYYELVKVVKIASGTCLAASYPQTGTQSPIESECKIPISTYRYTSLDLVQRESQWFFGYHQLGAKSR